jgi:hypothetical protein
MNSEIHNGFAAVGTAGVAILRRAQHVAMKSLPVSTTLALMGGRWCGQHSDSELWCSAGAAVEWLMR